MGGAFYGTEVSSSRSAKDGSAHIRSDLPIVANFDASRSSNIYQNNLKTVQPSSLTARYYIKF